jgi:hypothetical protein
MHPPLRASVAFNPHFGHTVANTAAVYVPCIAGHVTCSICGLDVARVWRSCQSRIPQLRDKFVHRTLV